jgi:hypothetical protein
LSSTPNESEKIDQAPSSVDISLLDIYQLLELFIMLLNEQAWRYMGLRIDPHTNETKKELEKARVAIDCIISLVDKMESNLAGAERERLRSLITDLQINYAQQVK